MKKITKTLLLSSSALLFLTGGAIASPMLASQAFGIVVKNSNATLPLKSLTVNFGKAVVNKTTGGNISAFKWNAGTSLPTLDAGQNNTTFESNAIMVYAITPVPPYSQMNGAITIPVTLNAVTESGVSDSYSGSLTVSITNGVVNSAMTPANIIGKNNKFICQYINTAQNNAVADYGTIDCSGP